MIDLFEELRVVCERHPATLATYSKAGWLHFGALGRNIEAVARYALGKGINPGDFVMVRSAQADVKLQITLGLLRLGCRVAFDHERDVYKAHGLSPDIVVSDEAKPPPGPRTITLGADWLQPRSVGRPLPERPAFSLIFASSGSTGLSKLIEISEHGFLHRIEAKLGDAYFGDRPRFLAAAGDSTSTTLQDSLVVLLKGGTIFRPFERHGLAILDAMQIHRPDYAVLAPATLVEMMKVLRETPATLPKIRMLRLAGSYCSRETQSQALEIIAEDIVTSYGATEIGRVAWGSFADTQAVARSVGRIKDDVEVVTVDGEGRQLAPFQEGELRIKVPPGVAATYPGSGPSNTKTFDGDWFIPGDVGKVDEQRNLIVLGRASHIINVGGTKVSPEAIEDAVANHANVRELGVIGVEGEDGYQLIYGAAVSRDPVNLERLNDYLQQKNPRFGVHVLKRVEKLPRTASGKIDRVALKRLLVEGGS